MHAVPRFVMHLLMCLLNHVLVYTAIRGGDGCVGLFIFVIPGCLVTQFANFVKAYSINGVL